MGNAQKNVVFFGPFFSGPKNDVLRQANFGSYYGEFVHITRVITTFMVVCDLSSNSVYQENRYEKKGPWNKYENDIYDSILQ